MKSKAQTVEDYINSLPKERKDAIDTVRDIILKNLPEGYEEAMNWGMISYQVPLSYYPDTYNKQPLLYAALASQKNHMAVYMSGIYMYQDLRQDFENKYKATGKKFDAGKSCVRFKKLDDLPIDLIGDSIATIPMKDFVNKVKTAHSPQKSKK